MIEPVVQVPVAQGVLDPKTIIIAKAEDLSSTISAIELPIIKIYNGPFRFVYNCVALFIL